MPNKRNKTMSAIDPSNNLVFHHTVDPSAAASSSQASNDKLRICIKLNDGREAHLLTVDYLREASMHSDSKSLYSRVKDDQGEDVYIRTDHYMRALGIANKRTKPDAPSAWQAQLHSKLLAYLQEVRQQCQQEGRPFDLDAALINWPQTVKAAAMQAAPEEMSESDLKGAYKEFYYEKLQEVLFGDNPNLAQSPGVSMKELEEKGLWEYMSAWQALVASGMDPDTHACWVAQSPGRTQHVGVDFHREERRHRAVNDIRGENGPLQIAMEDWLANPEWSPPVSIGGAQDRAVLPTLGSRISRNLGLLANLQDKEILKYDPSSMHIDPEGNREMDKELVGSFLNFLLNDIEGFCAFHRIEDSLMGTPRGYDHVLEYEDLQQFRAPQAVNYVLWLSGIKSDLDAAISGLERLRTTYRTPKGGKRTTHKSRAAHVDRAIENLARFAQLITRADKKVLRTVERRVQAAQKEGIQGAEEALTFLSTWTAV